MQTAELDIFFIEFQLLIIRKYVIKAYIFFIYIYTRTKQCRSGEVITIYQFIIGLNWGIPVEKFLLGYEMEKKIRTHQSCPTNRPARINGEDMIHLWPGLMERQGHNSGRGRSFSHGQSCSHG